MTSVHMRLGHRLVLPLLVLWLVLYFGVRVTLDSTAVMSPQWRVMLALLPTTVFALFLWSFIKSVRAADELERRIQLEALAIAFPLGLLLLTTLGLTQRAVALNVQDWSYNHIWPMFVLFYIAGLAFARRRYA